MQKELTLFKDLFTPCPNIAILFVNKSLDFLNDTLEEISSHNDGKVKYIEFINEKSCKISSTRDYEYVILGDILSYCPNKDKILKLMYKALENSGNIIILENKNNNNKDELLRLLEELGFQASNNINLFEKYNLITAKKMHHWDYGL